MIWQPRAIWDFHHGASAKKTYPIVIAATCKLREFWEKERPNAANEVRCWRILA